MELIKGQIVMSRKGRDTTKYYMVAGIEGDYVLLADGGKRTLDAPKRKNVRHIARTNTVLAPQDTESDLRLKAALKKYVLERQPEITGG